LATVVLGLWDFRVSRSLENSASLVTAVRRWERHAFESSGFGGTSFGEVLPTSAATALAFSSSSWRRLSKSLLSRGSGSGFPGPSGPAEYRSRDGTRPALTVRLRQHGSANGASSTAAT